MSIASNVLIFNDKLKDVNIKLPNNYKLVNSFKNDEIIRLTNSFYHKYYNDNKKRYLILGSSPARRGSALTGVPFEDVKHLYEVTGLKISDYHISKDSASFLDEVINLYGGYDKFYSEFLMLFTFPLGLVHINDNGKETNANYYENKELLNCCQVFIIETIKTYNTFGVDTSVCFVIGSNENYKFLSKINETYHFFDKIIALEHPRYIMQYNKDKKDFYLEKYLSVLRQK